MLAIFKRLATFLPFLHLIIQAIWFGSVLKEDISPQTAVICFSDYFSINNKWTINYTNTYQGSALVWRVVFPIVAIRSIFPILGNEVVTWIVQWQVLFTTQGARCRLQERQIKRAIVNLWMITSNKQAEDACN